MGLDSQFGLGEGDGNAQIGGEGFIPRLIMIAYDLRNVYI